MARATKGFFHNAMAALIEARSRQAQVFVENALRGMDDDTLNAYGYRRKELQKLGR